MTDSWLPFEPIPWEKPVDYSRGRDAETSREAFARCPITEERQRVLDWLKARGAVGGTAKEYASWAGKGLNAVSGRFSELHYASLIRRTDERREQSAVWVAE